MTVSSALLQLDIADTSSKQTTPRKKEKNKENMRTDLTDKAVVKKEEDDNIKDGISENQSVLFLVPADSKMQRTKYRFHKHRCLNVPKAKGCL